MPAVAVLASAITDLIWRQIPNGLTYPLLAAGVLVAMAGENIEASLLAWCLCWVPSLALFSLGIMGGGDVKLLSALGVWLEPYSAGLLLLGILALAASTSLGWLLVRRLRALLAPAGGAQPAAVIPLAPSIAMAFWWVQLGGEAWFHL